MIQTTAYNPRKYGALLTRTLPGVIEDGADYERLETVFNDLMNKRDNLAPEENRLFDLLANLLEDYEKRTLPPMKDSSPIETLKFLLQENGLRQSDLTDVFGRQSVVSEILNGKRQITKNQAKALAQRFNLRLEAFI